MNKWLTGGVLSGKYWAVNRCWKICFWYLYFKNLYKHYFPLRGTTASIFSFSRKMLSQDLFFVIQVFFCSLKTISILFLFSLHSVTKESIQMWQQLYLKHTSMARRSSMCFFTLILALLGSSHSKPTLLSLCFALLSNSTQRTCRPWIGMILCSTHSFAFRENSWEEPGNKGVVHWTNQQLWLEHNKGGDCSWQLRCTWRSWCRAGNTVCV